MTADRAQDPAPGSQITDLVRRLAETEAALQALTAGQTDAVLDPQTGTPLPRHDAQLKLQRTRDQLQRRIDERTAELRTSEARVRAIFQAAGVGIAVIDHQGRLRRSNAALQDMLGYSEDALQGIAFAAFLEPSQPDLVRQLYSSLHASHDEQHGRTAEIRYPHRSGEWRWASLTLSLVHANGDGSPWAVAILEDITERRRAQDALIRSEKLALTGRLATSLSHEINNPLQAVLGCLGLAEEMLENDPGVRRYIEIAEEELERVSRIVAGLRDLHEQSTEGERRETDINSLLQEVFLLTAQQRRDGLVTLRTALAGDLPLLLTISDRIRQVFLNVMLNAIDAMPDGGELYVSTSRTTEPHGIAISFADTGSGIDPDTLNLLFEPVCSTKPEGMGLGLYLARSIVESHGGHIDVDTRISEGTTFHIWLPA